ncbi:hypothetical protein [Pseudoxanthomonas putridarboris]|uniref:Lipoprotein n=1 Tax=Pseudoxanthomonas putridarboris TaxID=752605 RepID=A0ABU9J3S9_9GAMM
MSPTTARGMTMYAKKTLFAATAVCLLGACAPKPENVKPGYAPQAVYDSLSCQQIASEAINVSNKAHDKAGIERRHRHQDEAIVATGLIVFWPALFFTHGHSTQSASDLAQLKGEMEALEAASARKGCGIKFDRV